MMRYEFIGEGIRIADAIVDFTDSVPERMALYRTYQFIRDLPEYERTTADG